MIFSVWRVVTLLYSMAQDLRASTVIEDVNNNLRFVGSAHPFNACGAFFESGSGFGSRSTIDFTTPLYVRHQRRILVTAHVANQLTCTEILYTAMTLTDVNY